MKIQWPMNVEWTMKVKWPINGWMTNDQWLMANKIINQGLN